METEENKEIESDTPEKETAEEGSPEGSEEEKAHAPKARKQRFSRKYGKRLMPVFILVMVGLLAYMGFVRKQTADAKANAPQIEYRDVERRDISNSIAVTATVEADDKRTVSTLVSNTRVLDVNYKIGDYVEEGDVICTFDTTYVSENIARLQKKINVTSEKSKVTMNDAQIDTDKKGTTMAYNAQDNTASEQRKHWDYDMALAEYYNACDGYEDAKKEKEKKKDAYDSIKGTYNEWKDKYDRLTDEEKAGVYSDTDPDEVEEKKDINTAYNYYSGLYNTAKTAYETARRSVDDYESNIRSKQSALETARQGIEDAEKKTPRDLLNDGVDVNLYREKQYVASLDASIANDDNEQTMADYRKQLENSVVTAPISGMITVMNVHKGDEFAERSKTDVCVIQDDSGYTVKGNVDQYNISNVRVGMKALVKTQATGDDMLEGVVSFVSPVPASSSSASGTGSNQGASSTASTSVTYPVEIQLSKKDPRLRLGMTAETSLIVNERIQVLVVPYDCVTEDEYGYKCVYVETKPENGTDKPVEEKKSFMERLKGLFTVPEIKVEDNTRKVTVLTGLETDYYVEILTDEIKAGDRVRVPAQTDDKSDDIPGSDASPAMESVEGGSPEDQGNPPPPPPGGPEAGGMEGSDEGPAAGAGEF